MNSVLEEWKEEITTKNRTEIAIKLIKRQILSFEEIADITGLSLEKVQELASKDIA